MSNGSRVSAAENSNAMGRRARVNEALNLMLQALELIDKNEGPTEVGAHLDLAIHRLQESIESRDDKGG